MTLCDLVTAFRRPKMSLNQEQTVFCPRVNAPLNKNQMNASFNKMTMFIFKSKGGRQCHQTFKKSVIYIIKVNYTSYNYTPCNSTLE